MTGKHTYEVVTPYGTFTRTTAHVYTHVVVACGRRSVFYETLIKDAEKRYAKRPSTLNDYGWLESLKHMLAKSYKDQAEGVGEVLVWSHSLRNAETAVRTFRRRHNVVGIYEVPIPKEAS